MTRADVLAFLDLTDDLGIVPWLAGGFARGADSADDLDLFVDAKDAPTLSQHLTLRGFTTQVDEAWHLRFRDRHGRALDVRLFERVGRTVTHGPNEEWPAAVLDGYGLLGERAVRIVRTGG